MRRIGRPSGIPISRAFDIRPGIANDDLRAAVEAINRVHGDGVLPLVPMVVVRDLADAGGNRVDGLFVASDGPEGWLVPRSIRVRSDAPNRQFVALHEVGRLLDMSGLPGATLASASADVPELDEWRATVAETRAYRTLRALLDPATDGAAGRAAELLLLEELWARGYAQFVALRSGSPTLRESLDGLRRRDPGVVYYPRQWDDDDFNPVEASIDTLFRGLGWVT